MQVAEDFYDMPEYSPEEQVMEEAAYQAMFDAQHDQRIEDELAREARITARHNELAARVYSDAKLVALAQSGILRMLPEAELCNIRIYDRRG